MRAPSIKTQTFLSNLPMFQELDLKEIDRIAAGTSELRVEKGEVLFRRGDACKGFHAIVYGQVKLAFTSPQGSEKVVDVVGPGQSFGEALMFTLRIMPRAIYEMLPFIALQVVGLAVVLFFPDVALWLPRLLK